MNILKDYYPFYYPKQDSNLSVFNMIPEINVSETLTKFISGECKCKYDGRNVIQIKCGITINFDVSVKI